MNVSSIAHVIGVAFLVIFFYASSISLTFYNKWMSKRYTFPLAVTMVHFVVVFLLALISRKVLEIYTKKKRIVLGWSVYFKRIFPAAIAGSLDIGLSNWSIMLSTISIYTMAKSSSILFILFFSLIFGLEKPSRYLFIVILLISFGLFLFTFDSKQFNAIGFFLALLASVFSGIRWTLTQVIMQKDSIGMHNPLDVIYHIQPVMALTMALFAFSMEGTKLAGSSLLFNAPSANIALTSVAIILTGAGLAFLLTASEFLLVSNTSGIALSVAAIFKEICTLTIAAEFGGDKMTFINVIGLIICMLGISLHVITKASKESTVGPVKKHKQHSSKDYSLAMTSLLRNDGDISDSEDEIIWDSTLR